MKITYKGDYALKIILGLSLQYDIGNVVTIHNMAKQADIPVKFLEQVFLDLKRGGFVKSRRGKVGGYFLAKPPGQIKLGEVVRFIDGPLEPIACVERKYIGCKDISGCVFRNIWLEVTRAVSGIIDSITFEDLVNRVKTEKGRLVYTI